jgi:pteridine reductase
MEDLLAGRTALVTGAARRLGAEICLALAARGVSLLVHCRSSREEAEYTAARARALGAGAEVLAADFSSPGSAASLWRLALDRAPEHRIDFLVNNAAVFPGDELADVSIMSLEKCLQVNSVSPLELGRGLAAQGCEAAMVNLLDARLNDYDRGHVSYHLSKRMLFSLTRMMAREFAPAVRVNAVSPGLILPPPELDEKAGSEYLQRLSGTNLLGRHGSSHDVARAVLFLLESGFVTGQVLQVDGGRSLQGCFYG